MPCSGHCLRAIQLQYSLVCLPVCAASTNVSACLNLQHNLRGEPMRLTVRVVVKRFLDWASKALATGTVAAYSHQLKKFVKACGRKEATALRPADLTAWGKSWHEFQSVIRCFAWATHEAKLIKTNPFHGVKLPPRDERKRILSPAAMTQMLRSSSPPGREFLIALRETYARPQEIRAACWEDLQSEDAAVPLEEALENGTALIVLREYKARKRRKESNKPRILLVSKRLGRLLLRIANRIQVQQGCIFLNSKGVAWTNNGVRCLLRRLRDRLGIKPDRHGETVVAYTFRHSMATLASSKGIRDRTLADLLGHTETRTTARYQHLDVIHLREALERTRKGKAA